MKLTKVFMLDDHTGEENNSYEMDRYYTIKPALADELEEVGKAIKLDNMNEFDEHDKKISAEVNKFKKAYKAMEESSDPRYRDDAFLKEEAAKLKKELDEKVAELQSEYEVMTQATKDEAHRERANLVRNITPEDEKGAHQLMNELISVARLDGVNDAIERIEADLPYYSEGRKAAIANQLHRLIDVVDGDDRKAKRSLRSLSNRLREDTEGVEVAARMASALPDYTGTDYRTLRLTHRAYTGSRSIL